MASSPRRTGRLVERSWCGRGADATGNITVAPQAPVKHPRGICQDENLTTSTREAMIAATKTLTYHKHPRSHHRCICQDKNLTPSTRGAFATAFAKTKTLPQAPAELAPRHLPRQKPYHKHPRSLRHGICQDSNLTTSTRGAFTTAFAKTKTLPQALAELAPRQLPRQKPHPKHPRSYHPRHLPRQQPYPKHPRSFHRGSC